ncbi:MAG: 2Fe-2S iron-sulfur cluster binding domain-containing protein [Magnetococcales bacterium]|nr:2Fe-2S iron-sulfur cluster binding domain-containing protein [Magnetococcales bacterium]
MTAFKLTAWIGLVLAILVPGFAAWFLLRHWRDCQELKRRHGGAAEKNSLFPRVAIPKEPPMSDASPPSPVPLPPPAWPGMREMRVANKTIEDPDGTIVSFELVPVDGKPLPAFVPGQFLTFRLRIPDPATGQPTSLARCYSLSDRPGLESYRISVKRIPGGVGSGHLHDRVQTGAVLEVMAPSGRFCLHPGNDPVALIAGGIGITPLLSMINAQIARDPDRELWLFYGVRHSGEALQSAHLQALAERHPGFHYLLCCSQPGPEERPGVDYHHAGRVDITLLRLSLRLRPYLFYLCGPQTMLESLIPALEAWGVPGERIHTENFGVVSEAARPPLALPVATSALPVPRDAGGGGIVTFRLANKKVRWDGSVRTLLEFAENQGIEAPYGCRSGACGACQCVLEAGEVNYLSNPDYTPEPGTCLLCVTAPRTDLTLEL